MFRLLSQLAGCFSGFICFPVIIALIYDYRDIPVDMEARMNTFVSILYPIAFNGWLAFFGWFTNPMPFNQCMCIFGSVFFAITWPMFLSDAIHARREAKK